MAVSSPVSVNGLKMQSLGGCIFLSKSVDKILLQMYCKTENLVVLLTHRKKKGCECVLKLLIADAGENLPQLLTKQLKNRFEICRSIDGPQTLEKVFHLKPDVLVLDLQLSQIDGLEVLRTIRAAGISIPVLVIGSVCSDWICAELAQLRVTAIFRKPCDCAALISRILAVAEELSSGKMPSCTPERLAHHMLLNLGFRMGFARYECVYLALLLKFQGECGGITKCLYPKAAKLCGGNTQQVEKAVRDAIKDAFKLGNSAVWQMYFPQEALCCPSNEVFLARIAFAMKEYFGQNMTEIANSTEKYA